MQAVLSWATIDVSWLQALLAESLETGYGRELRQLAANSSNRVLVLREQTNLQNQLCSVERALQRIVS